LIRAFVDFVETRIGLVQDGCKFSHLVVRQVQA
jgi:hypothetical protein